MAKKLLSEAQVRKFMGLAKMDANLSSNFLKEMYHNREDEEMMNEEEEMDDEVPMDDVDLGGGDSEEPADMDEPEMDAPDVDMTEDEVKELVSTAKLILNKFDGAAGMDDMPDEEPPMEEPEMDMGGEEEIDADVDLEPTEDEIVQEVAKRVAKRINEAARAQKKADRLLGRKK